MTRGLFLSLLFFSSSSFGQASNLLKKIGGYLPSLSEIGFVTGAVNVYVQTASLVRAVNKEIAFAKSMSGRLDDLKSQTEKMVGGFRALSEINPYDMDSWAGWLSRAQGYVTEETSDFTDVLFGSVLSTIDDKMTVGFYQNVRRGLSYDATQGEMGAVLRAYYSDRDYEVSREKIRAIAQNEKRLEVLQKEAELMRLTEEITNAGNAPERESLIQKRNEIQAEIGVLEDEMKDPSLGGTATDKQIAFLMDLAQSLGGEVGESGRELEKHGSDLKRLIDEWELARKDRLPKVKNRNLVPVANPPSRPLIYDERNPDRVPSPLSDVDKPKTENTSESSAKTTLPDLLHIQNEIEMKRLEMMESGLRMDILILEGKAALLAVEAYKKEKRRNARVAVSSGAGALADALGR